MKKLALLPLVLAACGTDGAVDSLPDSTIEFAPTSIALQRFTVSCSPDEQPPFSSQDQFQLSVTGANPISEGGTNQPTTIFLSFHSTLPRDMDLPVDLGDFSVTQQGFTPSGEPIDLFGQFGTLPLDGNSFNWQQGIDTTEIDDQPLDNVRVRVIDVPTAEGETGTVIIRMEFTDGQVFDMKYSAPVTTGFVGCPVG